MTRQGFKVVIVGGGVAGLTLANILEQLKIDFVLLEAYPKIAPPVGASIGLWPNGLRILDQLGCYDAFAGDGGFPDDLRLNVKGKRIGRYLGISSQMRKRHGYDVIFHDRQKLLQVLYDNLKQKNRILVDKRVIEVNMTDSGVSIETQDHDTFAGDIVVGVDGIHSAIRGEMQRIAAEIAPGYLPTDELKRMQVKYRAMFGIAKPTKTLPATVINPVWYRDRSYLVFGGPNGRVYWFMFEKLAQPLNGDDVPRYTKDDQRDLITRHGGDVITEEVTLRDLYNGSISAGLTGLHECVFERWHFGRIITLGDAAHKMNPITGQGGNVAIESVTALANALTSRLDVDTGAGLTDEDIDAVFRETQAVRQDRAALAVNIAREVQRVEAMESRIESALVPLLLPLVSCDMRLERQSGVIVDAVRVDKLAMPAREHFVPYTDELPATPLTNGAFRGIAKFGVAICFLGLFCSSALYAQPGKGEFTRSFFGLSLIPMSYTGTSSLDTLLGSFARLFSSPVPTNETSQQIHDLYSAAMLVPAIVIWTLEGYRRGNSQNLPSRVLIWPSIFIAASRVYGIGKVAPLYFLLTLLQTDNGLCQRTVGRIVDPVAAQAMLPALGLGYAVPAALSFLLSDNGAAWQNTIAAWQVIPVYFGVLTTAVLTFIRGRHGAISEKRGQSTTSKSTTHSTAPDPDDFAVLNNDDVPHLLSAYTAVCVATAIVHVWAVGWTLTGSASSLPHVLFGNLHAGTLDLHLELAIYVACILIWCLYTVFKLRQLGYVETGVACLAAVSVVVSCIAMGPGAMYAGTWYWRERTIVRLSR